MRPVIARALKSPPRPMCVEGWVQTVRKMKKVAFADINDGSGPTSLSAVLEPGLAEKLTTGASVRLFGEGRKHPSKDQLELHVEKVELLGGAGPEYPLQKKFHTREFLRQLPHLRWRTRQGQQVLRYRSWAIQQLNTFFNKNDVFQVNSPVITSSDCEGAGEAFALKNSSEFFKRPAYLSVSSQLHLEVYAAALGRVWNLTPAFRAEASDTNRHLAEFWMVEAELSFIDELSELTNFCESMTREMIPSGQVAEDLLASKRDSDDRLELTRRWEMVTKPWTSISYTEALKLLNAKEGLPSLQWGDDIPSEHEKALANDIIGGVVVVTDYPKSLKPFYMKESSLKTVACFDVLCPQIGEIVGGSLREDSYDLLVKNMKLLNMDTQALDWYLDLRRFGSIPHGGYGLGFERVITYLCGLENIRDATGFIRGVGQLPC